MIGKALLGLLVGLLLPTQSLASTIRGTVRLPGGAGLAGALITVVQVGGEQGPWTGTTGANGTYSITDPLIFGNLSVSVSRPNTLFVPTFREFFDDGVSTITSDFSAFTNSPVDATSMQVRRTGVLFDSGADPLGLPTTAFFEYGIGPALDHQSPPVSLFGTARQSARFSLLPVPPAGSVVQARLVVTNALGRSEGPVQQFIVPSQQFAARFSAERSRFTPFWSLLAADYNRDGQMDFVWMDESSFNANPPFTGSGPDLWSHSIACESCLNLSMRVASFIDYNRDNRPDLFMVDVSGSTQIAQQDQPNGDFGKIFSGRNRIFSLVRNETIDVNRDGRDDMVQQAIVLSVYVQNETGDFGVTALDAPFFNQTAASGDLNGDGFPDIAVIGNLRDGRTIVVKFLGDGEGGFKGPGISEEIARIIGVHTFDLGLAFADLDGNGTLDIIAMARLEVGDRIRMEIYWNDGKGNFADRHVTEVHSATLANFAPLDLTSGDFDNDGFEDLLLSGSPCLLITAPKRVVRIEPKLELAPLVDQALRFDADGDGRLDLLVTGRTPDGVTSVQVMKNNIPAANRAPSAPEGLRAFPSSRGARFEWDVGAGDDLTPPAALSWNIRVGTQPGSTDIVSPLADLATGRRYILNPGNAGQTRFFDLSLPAGVKELFWSVQAVDAGYLGGAWAPEQVVRLAPSEPFRLTDVVFELNGTVRVLGEGDGLGAILNRSEDLIHWTPVSPFEAVGEAYQAIDSTPQTSSGRYYSAR